MFKYFIISFICLITSNIYSKTIKICYEDQDYSPYISDLRYSHKGRGILVDLVEMSVKSVGLDVEFIRRPWKRCLSMMKNGSVDAIFAALWTKEREAWAAFPKKKDNLKKLDESLSLWDSQYVVFKRVDSELSYSGGKFKNVISGIDAPPGYVAYKMLKDMKVLSRSNNTPEKGLKLVRLKRIDGYVVERNIGNYIINKNKSNDVIDSIGEVFFEGHWFLPFSKKFYKKSPELSSKIWNMIAIMKKKNGSMLIKKYSK